MLPTQPDDLIDLRCGEKSLYIGKMGRKAGHIAIQIEGDAPRKEDT
jgi:flagellar motor switch protein FliM